MFIPNDITDLSIDSFNYSILGCDIGQPYASTQITVVNEGNTVVNELCLNFDILPDGIPVAQYCFDNLNLLKLLIRRNLFLNKYLLRK